MKKKSNNKEGRGNMERVEGKNRMEPFECKAGEGSETAVVGEWVLEKGGAKAFTVVVIIVSSIFRYFYLLEC